ncbi:hypothetical protein OBK23_14370, partial [Empedobacter falsenii]|uniref:hypothetical protein n=1 Tax=Empedobacter falsenii TaxID=343874 RepID=UPI003A80475C
NKFFSSLHTTRYEKLLYLVLCNKHIVLAIGGLNGFVSTEVQNSISVLRLKFSAKNPAHRQYAARYVQPYQTDR